MKTLKIFTLILLFFSSVIISCTGINCGKDTGECFPAIPYFKIKKIQTTIKKFSADKATETIELDKNEKVNYKDFYFTLDFDVEYISLNHSNISGSLYACSPKECPRDGYKGSKIGLTSIDFVLLNNYNDTLKANDTINSIILFDNYRSTPIKDDFDKSISTFVNLNDDSFDNFFNYHFKLDSPPSTNGEQRIQVVMKMDNGIVYKTTTTPVYLTK